ncbi:TerD family protein, partial [Salmonella enterica subsp. enterica serovar Kentucky]
SVNINTVLTSRLPSTETAMVFGELYRHGAEWKFKAVGQGFAGGLAALASQHGVNI